MVRKAITVVVLLAVATWAEFSVAPMLGMQAHPHSGHAKPADMPAHAAMHHSGHHGHEMTPPEKPCCPGLHGKTGEEGLTIAAETPGCDSSHRCCFRQGPQSVPSPVRDVERQGQEAGAVSTAEIDLPLQASGSASYCNTRMAARPPDLLGMTFRV